MAPAGGRLLCDFGAGVGDLVVDLLGGLLPRHARRQRHRDRRRDRDRRLHVQRVLHQDHHDGPAPFPDLPCVLCDLVHHRVSEEGPLQHEVSGHLLPGDHPLPGAPRHRPVHVQCLQLLRCGWRASCFRQYGNYLLRRLLLDLCVWSGDPGDCHLGPRHPFLRLHLAHAGPLQAAPPGHKGEVRIPLQRLQEAVLLLGVGHHVQKDHPHLHPSLRPSLWSH
mmetsp:Transcript_9851/g.9707  ORF Transcript_9851/g.9707 Transcript_9851/m.9707 type:complete len:221 (+) Transcript_9851:1815-2477(+)